MEVSGKLAAHRKYALMLYVSVETVCISIQHERPAPSQCLYAAYLPDTSSPPYRFFSCGGRLRGGQKWHNLASRLARCMSFAVTRLSEPLLCLPVALAGSAIGISWDQYQQGPLKKYWYSYSILKKNNIGAFVLNGVEECLTQP